MPTIEFYAHAEDCGSEYNKQTGFTNMTNCDGHTVFCIKGKKSSTDMFRILDVMNHGYRQGVTAGIYKQQRKIKDALGIDPPF